ncbi:MAG: hypothetical protein ACI8RZ_000620 [Myxococcota bacterium]|jgi:hypothetical protein
MIRLTSMAVLLSLTALIGCGEKDTGEVEEEVIDNDGDGVPEGEDCNDWSGVIYPGAPEVCDDVDNDCDGEIDEDAVRIYYADADGDGYGLEDQTIGACEPPSGYAEVFGDCDDTNPDANPGLSVDVCDDVDNDCDTEIDEDVVYADYYIDADGDGYGADDGKDVINDCAAPEGYASTNDDCDDTYDQTYPDAIERCDNKDNSCDGQIDYQYVDEWYLDSDGDGYGDESTETEDCDPPTNYVPDDGLDIFDCDDTDGTISPVGVELCDGINNDCDDETDEEMCYTIWSGEHVYEQGVYTVPTQRDCEFYYTSTSSTRASTAGCESCEFAFEVELSYDSASSSDNGSCAGLAHWTGDAMAGDTTYVYGYSADFYGYYGSYGPQWMMQIYAGYWYPMSYYSPQVGVVEFEESTGYFRYTYGYKDFDYAGTYFTYYHHGEAYVE